MKSILLIQTAFTGDVILATAVAESLHKALPGIQIDFLLRRGNENLLQGHPFLRKVIAWDKKSGKLLNLLRIISAVRKARYDCIINLHRFASSGLVTLLSGAPQKRGFDKNPLSFCYTHRQKHVIGDGRHETERNHSLLAGLVPDAPAAKPALYPAPADLDAVRQYQQQPYVCMAPASVWFTKQLPEKKWTELAKAIPPETAVYTIGSAADAALCTRILEAAGRPPENNLCGRLTLLQSAALIKDAAMNYVNDSAPLHLASAMNAPVTAFFCSTVPAFGFGPLSGRSVIAETPEQLACRPCGLHGFRKCPQEHFRCGEGIDVSKLSL